MKNKRNFLVVLMMVIIVGVFFLLPVKRAFVFIEVNPKSGNFFYIPMKEEKAFQIRYVHSIHLTDVFESYEVTTEDEIRMISMDYESLSIGLPGEASEGETLVLRDGVYTLTYKDRVIDSFTMRIGNIEADLAFRYEGKEVDLKGDLEKSKSYAFKVKKLTCYQVMKGVNLYG